MSKQAGQTKPTQQNSSTKPKSNEAATQAKKPTVTPDFSAKPVAVLHGATSKDKTVTAAEIHRFVHEKAGGAPSRCVIELLDNVDKKADSPLPYTRMSGDGKRASIAWMLVNGFKGDHRLDTIVREAGKLGMSGSKCADIVAALNGGFSPSSKTYGTAYVRIAAYPVKPQS